jgi:hypothetical protein
MRERATWVAHWTEDSVDALLHGQDPTVQLRRRLPGQPVTIEDLTYDSISDLGGSLGPSAKAPSRQEAFTAGTNGAPSIRDLPRSPLS